MHFLSAFAFPISACLAHSASNILMQPQAVLIDTDIMSDVDDVGAIAVANVLHNCGIADLRGIAINTHSKYGALAANVRDLLSCRTTG